MAVHTTKCKIAKKEKSDRLYKAILTLETEEECYNFFQDLCTIPELRSMEQRYEQRSHLQRHSGAHRRVQRHHQPCEPQPDLRRGRL